MWSSDFRHIAFRGENGRADGLLRAAVSAFCSLTRPSRRDAAQLEDLAVPLLERVSVESRRYVAAALSEVGEAPNGLVRRLCEEPVDIAAPLLVRSGALADIDLIALIGRHGMPHARAIARRPGLNKTIADLIRALEGPKLVATTVHTQEAAVPNEPTVAPPADAITPAETARQRLRRMMLPESAPRSTVPPVGGLSVYPRLRDTALSGNPAFFHTALADALAIDFHAAGVIAQSEDPDALPLALRALDLGPEKAFLIAASLRPTRFSSAPAIRLFLDSYRRTTRDAALDWLAGRRENATYALAADRPAAMSEPANQAGRRAGQTGKLRAS